MVRAIKDFWTRMFQFDGHTSRFDFWVGAIGGAVIVWVIGSIIMWLLSWMMGLDAAGGQIIWSTIFTILLLLYVVALITAFARRMRDAGFSPWLSLLALVPVAQIVAWVLALFPTKKAFGGKHVLNADRNPNATRTNVGANDLPNQDVNGQQMHVNQNAKTSGIRPSTNMQGANFAQRAVNAGQQMAQGSKATSDVQHGKVDVNQPNVNDYQPQANLNGGNVDANFKAPKMNMDTPNVDANVKAPNMNMDTPNVDANVKAPNMNMDTPNVDANVKAPNMNVDTPNVDANVKAPKMNMDTPNVDANVKAPKMNMDMPNVDANVDMPSTNMQANVDMNRPNVDLQADAPSTNMQANLDVKQPDVDLQADMPSTNMQANVDVDQPNVDLQADMPSTNMQAQVDMPSTNMQGNVNMPNANVQGPNMNVDTPNVDANVQGPNTDFDPSNVGGNIKAPKMNMDTPNVDANVQGNVDMSKGSMNIDPNLPAVEKPNMDVNADMPSTNMQANVNMPNANVQGPNMDFDPSNVGGNIKAPNVDANVQGPNVNMDTPDVNANVQGNVDMSKGSMNIDPNLPAVEKPDMDVNAEMPSTNMQGNVNMPSIDANVRTPNVDVNAPNMQGNVDTSYGNSYVDMSTDNTNQHHGQKMEANIDMPESHVHTPHVEGNDVQLNHDRQTHSGQANGQVPFSNKPGHRVEAGELNVNNQHQTQTQTPTHAQQGQMQGQVTGDESVHYDDAGDANMPTAKIRQNLPFDNSAGQLPMQDANGNAIRYKAFDIYPVGTGAAEDAQHFVHGDDGRTYYTEDNYQSFVQVIDGDQDNEI